MFSAWLFLIMSNMVAWLSFVPLIDKDLSLLDRSSRITVLHQIFTLRDQVAKLLYSPKQCPSSESRALNEIIALYDPQIDLEEEHTFDDILAFRRKGQRLLSSLYPVRSASCRIDKESFQAGNRNLTIYLIRHDNRLKHWRHSDQPMILYFHGGGFFFGGNETYFGFECDLSKTHNQLVIHIDYKPVPEQPLPVTVKDTFAVYEYLLRFDATIPRRLIGMGDSSGGMLWIHLLQWLVQQNKPTPRAVVLHSPWSGLDFTEISLTAPSTSYMSLDMAFTLRRLIIGKGTNWYKLGQEEKDRYSPNNHAFHGFPPLYITTSTKDAFIDQIQSMVKKIKDAGGEVLLDISQGSMHAFPLFHRWLPEGRCVQAKVLDWIQRQSQLPSTLSWQNVLRPKISCKS